MRTKYLVAILVLLALALPALPAHAGGVVTVCDEAHLLAALTGGGTVTFTCSGTITLTAEITIAADTTIDGSGRDVTISGNHAVRVFTVNSNATVNLNRLTVADGYTSGNGGGINNTEGTLIVSNSTFSGNSADYGGGIYNTGYAMLTVSNSTFSGNSAGFGGGIAGIEYLATLTVDNSTFSGNTAQFGGGIYNLFGPLSVNNSTISGNSAAYYGGGIQTYGGTLTVSNSTFSGNSVLGSSYSSGGGIANRNQATVTVSNSTFFGNNARGSHSSGGAIYNDSMNSVTVSNSTFSGNTANNGGGIYNYNYPYDTVTLKNTIVANSPSGGNCFGTLTDDGGNLSYPDTTCPGINSDPLLGPLQNNGGPTQTMALGPGSAAIDAGIDAICAAAPVNGLDQRGIARPQGAGCDIGAVELIQEPAVVSLSVLSAKSLSGTPTPTIIAGLLLATLMGVGVRQRRRRA